MSALRRFVLVVDDEAIIADLWRHHLEAIDVEVCGIAYTAKTAIDLAQAQRPALVLMDVRLRGGGDGVDAANEIQQSVGSKIIFVTGSREPETVARMQAACPAAILFKPVLNRQLDAAVLDALREFDE